MRMIRLFWLATTADALAGSDDPGSSAIRFLEKVRDQKLNLEPGGDTALAPQTADSKRREIARRLARMARELDQSPLEVGEIRQDGELAAVLVRKGGGFDPNRMRVFPVALVRDDDAWKPAPLPASFENTGLGYSAPLRKRMESLKEWMLRGQVFELARMRDQSSQRIREHIGKSLSLETLRSLDPLHAATRFFHAASRRDLPEILGLLGGLSSQPPDDWSARLASAESAIAARDIPRPWRLLASADVLRAIVHHEQDGETALVSLCCLDPAGKSARSTVPKIEILHFELSKTREGYWRIDPPTAFLDSAAHTGDVADEGPDMELIDTFARRIAEAHPPKPRPAAVQAARDLGQQLKSGALSDLVSLLAPEKDTDKARENLLRAAQTWWSLRNSPATQIVSIGCREEGAHSVVFAQFFSFRSPDHLDLRTFHFINPGSGWLWTPVPRTDVPADLEAWTREETQRRQENWVDDLLGECVKLTALPESGAPSENEARTLLTSWLKAVRDGDVEEALRHCARLDKPHSGNAVLHNLAHEITGLQRAGRLPGITGVQRDGGWAAVAVESASGDAQALPLYPIVPTAAGPRLLIELDLVAAAGRSRDFLNRASLDRLRDDWPDQAAALKRLFETHEASHKAPAPR